MKKFWYRPTFAAILENRTESLVLVGAGLLQVGLHLFGLPGWACPFKELFGLPCPGCGLTTAVGQLLRGHFGQSFQTHAFAPVFLGAFALMALVTLLPKRYSAGFTASIARFESKTGMTAWLLMALLGYWVMRLLDFV